MIYPIDVPQYCEICPERSLKKIDHPLNRVDWRQPYSSQGYQMYQCEDCGALWGCRYQYDSGTGADDHWHRFEVGEEVRRHY